MGRTVATFTQLIYEEMERWKKFRRTLRKEDQEVLDELFSYARYHAQAGSYMSGAIPFESIVISMLIEEHKRVKELERRIKEMEKKDEKGNPEGVAF